MNISIEVTKDLLDYLDGKVGQGYTSRSEVTRDAIRKLIQEDIRREARMRSLTLDELNKTRIDISGELIEKKYRHYL